ncbi:uncharacterized protein N7477_005142 [Penicillium maclennaniae]|uniref:uncharacterized protein n=1 Tax=Penicillium maclennaniae TaxID=1343394 RepID=UPI00253F9A3D|nr:uncharacterized protein N7477_005142 [Penicillium maclennaniae]KAJ5675208.1 hypothetical protein N7477_005142 [Penicillium maclennaniae]
MKPRVILITGANRGNFVSIGKGLAAEYLAMSGTTVVATVRDASAQNASQLSSLPKGQNKRLIMVRLSLDAPSTVTEAIEQIQKQNLVHHVDIVIANAGICNHWGPVLHMNDSDLTSHFEINELGPLRLCRAAAPLLESSKEPRFVYLSSELASITGLENSSSLTAGYGISKVACNYLVKKLHEEHKALIAFSIDPGEVLPPLFASNDSSCF